MLITITVAVAKIALLVFVIGGGAAIVIRGIRRSRANRRDPRWNEHRGQPSHEASAHGTMPPIPLPEWVHWDTEDDE
jgi:hypothetical protein